MTNAQMTNCPAAAGLPPEDGRAQPLDQPITDKETSPDNHV